MKASEVVEILKDSIKKYGDLPVYAIDGSERYEEVEHLHFNDEDLSNDPERLPKHFFIV